MRDRSNPRAWLRAGIILLLAILAVSCSDSTRVPGPIPSQAALLPLSQGQGSAESTPTPDPGPRIGRLVLTTAIASDTEAPKTELTTVPATASVIYLVVEVSALPGKSTLSAVWDFGDTEVGRTTRTIPQPVTSARWIALTWQPQQPLKVGDYTVHLLVDDREIDSIVFTVTGRIAQEATAAPERQLLFATNVAPDVQRIQPATLFPAGVTTIVALVPNAGALVSANVRTRWYRNDQLVAELGPDPVSIPNLLTFTLTSQQPLLAGSYRVELLLDGTLALSGQFQILSPTPTASKAAVEQVLVVTMIDPTTHAPSSTTSVPTLQAPASVYVAVLVRDLTPSDLLEVVWYRNDAEILRVPISGLQVGHQWINVPYQIPAQSPGTTAQYRVVVRLNSQPAGQQTVQVRS